MYPPAFMLRFESFMFDKDVGEEKMCLEFAKGIAMVQFQLADQIVTRIKRDLRVSFADQLSNIGDDDIAK